MEFASGYCFSFYLDFGGDANVLRVVLNVIGFDVRSWNVGLDLGIVSEEFY